MQAAVPPPLPTPDHEGTGTSPPLARPAVAAVDLQPRSSSATMHAQGKPVLPLKAEDSYPSPPQDSIAREKKPFSVQDIPLPSFVDEAAFSASDSDNDSSSDEDEFGEPKPPRPVRTSKHTGLPRPRPNYYYDEAYDAGTAGPKKRHGRRGGFKGVPVFEPTMQDFEGNGGFYGYVKRIEKYGMRSGIVKVIPPKEWTDALPSVADPLRSIRLRDAIEQHMVGSQGLYRVMNEAKARVWNPVQWKERAVRPQSDAPDLVADEKRGDRSERAAVSGTKRRRASNAAAPAAGSKRRASVAGENGVDGADDEADNVDEATGGPLPKGRRTPARKAKGPVDLAPDPNEAAAANVSTAKKARGRPALRVDPTDDEWAEFTASLYDLPHGMQKSDYTVERMRDFERRYWRTLTFGEPPMYGADMAGSLFKDETKAWNVAHLGDLLPKLAPSNCEIPGVVSPYLYFGQWRATFAWHVEDADLYSINYIHFGAPKFWYSVPQEQAKRFERVMEGLFPTDRSKCSQFLRHKAFLASPKVLSNHGITLNRCAQLPGEFILTYPKGYHSGFNLGFNCAESINFATERWLPLGKVTKHCHCIEDSVAIDVNVWLRQAAKEEALARGEEWPYDDLEEQAAIEAEAALLREGEAKVEAKKRAASEAALQSSQPRKKAKPAALPAAAYMPNLTPLQRQHLILTPAMPSVPASSVVTMTLYQALQSPDILDIVKAQLNQLLHHPSGQWGIHSQIRLQAIPNPNPRPAYLDVPPPPPPPQNPYSNAAFHYYPARGGSGHGYGYGAGANASAPSTSAARSATPQSAPQAPPTPPQPDWPCALCPDMSKEGLVRFGEAGQKAKKNLEAHRICVTFTPATWIETDLETGEEMVRGFGKIEKARWKLKCQLCTEMHGTKVQCTKGKCAKAFHVTCALQEGSGVFLDATVSDAEHESESVGTLEQAKSPSAAGASPAATLPTADAPSPATDAPDAAGKVGSTTTAGDVEATTATSSSVPSASASASAAQASSELVQLTILCRTHNPDWQRQEAERRTAELNAKVDALKPGERIRVKTSNGNYDVNFIRIERDKETLFFSFDDGKHSWVKWKNVVWPDPPEVLRKKQEKALRAEREKMAILDRPAYKAPTKRISTPTDYVAQASVHAQTPIAPIAAANHHVAGPMSALPTGPSHPQVAQPSSSHSGYGYAHAQQHSYVAAQQARAPSGGYTSSFAQKPSLPQWQPSPPTLSFSQGPYSQPTASIAPFSSFGSMPSGVGSTFGSTWSNPSPFAASDTPYRSNQAQSPLPPNPTPPAPLVSGASLLTQARSQAHTPVSAAEAAPPAPPQNPLLAAAAAAQAGTSPTA